MKRVTTGASIFALAVAVAACSTPVPQALKTSDIPAKFDGPIPSTPDTWPKREWWHGFGSTEMDGLIAEAEANNLDIAVAAANVLSAMAQANIERSALFPTITAGASAERQQSPGNSAHGATVIGPSTYNAFGMTANASYAPDIWGLAQDNLRAAEESLKSSRFAKEEVALTTVADVGTTYMSVLALREEITLAKQNLEDAKRVLVVTQAKLKYGVDSQLDEAQEEAVVEGQEAQIPVLIEEEHEARLALAILLGRAPEGFDVTAQNLDGIQMPLVAPGMPSDLLLHRPDIAEAEASLASAHANVDAARAAFFPAVSLTGSAGTASSATGLLFHASTFEWSAGASALQTLFDAGKLFAQSDMTKAQQLSVLATYRKTVISAFSSVETSLGQVTNYETEQLALEREVKASAEAFRISELQYREGIVDITSVIQTQQTLFTAENSLVQARLARAQAVVGLYQALGGGWTENSNDVTQHLPGTTEAAEAPVPNPEDSMWKAVGSVMP